MAKTTVICFGWTWQSSELCRLQVLCYSSVPACMVVITDLFPCDLYGVMWYYVQCDKSSNLLHNLPGMWQLAAPI